jgi:RNA polymerase sigma-70 factor, ECF subfamily
VPTHEKPSFESILHEHGAFIRRTLARLGVASRDLRDVEQEVLRGVSRRLPMFDPALAANPAGAVRGWLYSICERQAANHRRNRMRRGELLCATEELDNAAAAGPTTEERLILEQRRALVTELLEELEPQRRAVLVAYELEDVPMADIAAAFSIPVNTAWNRLRLAREDLREAWGRMERRRRRPAAAPDREVDARRPAICAACGDPSLPVAPVVSLAAGGPEERDPDEGGIGYLENL